MRSGLARVVGVAAAILMAAASSGEAAKGKAKSYPLWDGKEPVAAYAKRAKLKPIEKLDLGGGVPLEMVLVPAGTFTMGSPDSELKTEEHTGHEPLRKVTISRPFYLSKYEITQAQFAKVMGEDTSKTKGESLPATNVSWDEALVVAKRFGEAVKRDIRIPTDAQWEYAARAGTQTTVYTGNDEAAVHSAGWCAGNSPQGAHPVGEKAPNAFGLYDMIGNVREWTHDVHGPAAAVDAVDPEGPAAGDMRISRGGAFTGRILVCRAAIRNVEPATKKSSIIGLRLAMEP
jgi:formylglycine-generating enzyme required for sulfatase activity